MRRKISRRMPEFLIELSATFVDLPIQPATLPLRLFPLKSDGFIQARDMLGTESGHQPLLHRPKLLDRLLMLLHARRVRRRGRRLGCRQRCGARRWVRRADLQPAGGGVASSGVGWGGVDRQADEQQCGGARPQPKSGVAPVSIADVKVAQVPCILICDVLRLEGWSRREGGTGGRWG